MHGICRHSATARLLVFLEYCSFFHSTLQFTHFISPHQRPTPAYLRRPRTGSRTLPVQSYESPARRKVGWGFLSLGVGVFCTHFVFGVITNEAGFRCHTLRTSHPAG